jgi:cytidylate kinase
MRDNRATESFGSLEETEEKLRERKASERKRYKELYGVDCKDLSNYDLVVDTTFASPEEVACCIIDALKEWEEDKTKRACFVCPRRFLYPDDAPDFSRVEKLSALLDEGMEDVGTVQAVEADGTFYATGNVEVALAYSLSDVALVPTRLTVGEPPRGTFVPMADNL